MSVRSRWNARRSGDPAIRRSRDPAIRRSGDPHAPRPRASRQARYFV
jgi:hypothetical protein